MRNIVPHARRTILEQPLHRHINSTLFVFNYHFFGFSVGAFVTMVAVFSVISAFPLGVFANVA
tara:strand:+ start:324 stop:512 length:189 start_codon:yes stop_codon:yes gene_type:complete